MSELAPIVLFVYNRPEHTRRTLEAVRANHLASRSRLFIFSDGPKTEAARPAVEAVRRYVRAVEGFTSVEVIERERNQGLANSVIAGITKVVNEYGRVIVLEDDIVTSPFFLDYMNDGLNLYADEERVSSIHGDLPPLDVEPPQSYFLPYYDCWGWGTWARAWRDFEPDAQKLLSQIKERGLIRQFNLNGSCSHMQMLRQQIKGKIDSWAIRWYASHFLKGMVGLYPQRSFVENIGFDGTGVHFKYPAETDLGKVFNSKMTEGYSPLVRIPVQVNEEVLASMERFQRRFLPPPLIVRAFRKARRLARRAMSVRP